MATHHVRPPSHDRSTVIKINAPTLGALQKACSRLQSSWATVLIDLVKFIIPLYNAIFCFIESSEVDHTYIFTYTLRQKLSLKQWN
jgi:hypothetical protein